MYQTLAAAVLLFAFSACSGGSANPAASSDKKDPPAKNGKTVPTGKLKIGDSAPALKPTAWLNGTALPPFESGKVYVLDFWATWCGPCIQMMPHLSELAHTYEKQGLIVAAVTTTDNRNPKKAIESFVAKRGPKLGFRFAVCEDESAEMAFMQASESNSLPTTFVVDQKGKIAYIGHPMNLDDVLPKVFDGTWKGQADVDEIEAAFEELQAILQTAEGKPEEALVKLASYEKKYPTKAKKNEYQTTKLVIMLFAKKYDDAKALTERLMPELIAAKNGGAIGSLMSAWSEPQLNPEKKHIDLAVKAAEALLTIEGDKDARPLVTAALAYKAAGDKVKALALTEKALAATDDPDFQKYLKAQIEELKK